MHIVDIRETAIPLNSNLSNSGFNFSEMATSVVISEKLNPELLRVEFNVIAGSRM